MDTAVQDTINRRARWAWAAGLALLIAAPFVGLYPVFMMKALCYAIFACAFNLLLGYTGLLSFGHAAYLGAAASRTTPSMMREFIISSARTIRPA